MYACMQKMTSLPLTGVKYVGAVVSLDCCPTNIGHKITQHSWVDIATVTAAV